MDGGSANYYDYAGQDPVNQFDLDGRMFPAYDGCWGGDIRVGGGCGSQIEFENGRRVTITSTNPNGKKAVKLAKQACYFTGAGGFVLGAMDALGIAPKSKWVRSLMKRGGKVTLIGAGACLLLGP